jgi:hypothetical protein
MTPTKRIKQLATPKESVMNRFWPHREKPPEMHDLGLAARNIAADIIDREARSRRAMAAFAVVLSLAVGAVLLVLGSGGTGA